MAATEAILGYDTTIEVETAADSGIYFELAEVTAFTPPQRTIEQVDATHMKSPGRTREFIPGFGEYGSMTVDMNYLPGSDTDDFIVAWEAAAENRSVRITWPNGVIHTLPGNVEGYAPSGIDTTGKMGITLTIKGAGDLVRS